MRIDRVVVGPLDVNCWVISDDAAGPAVVVDPGDDAEAVAEALDGREVAAIVLTHAHFDHIGAVGALVASSGAPLLVHEADAERLGSADPSGTGGALFGFDTYTSPPADRVLVDGDAIRAGSVSIQVIHTPGHTAGGICLLVQDERSEATDLFSGDTLFAGSVGRTDFPGGDARALKCSLARLAGLDESVRVHPGHGPDTTIGRERRINPFWPRA